MAPLATENLSRENLMVLMSVPVDPFLALGDARDREQYGHAIRMALLELTPIATIDGCQL